MYQTDRGQELLVESAQSVANRMELVCWDQARQDVIEPLAGISYVRVERDGDFLTSSILEAHRINSPYILESKDRGFHDTLQAETNALDESAIDFGLLRRWDAAAQQRAMGDETTPDESAREGIRR